MSSPPQRPPASAPPTATQPLPRAFLATSSPRRAAAAATPTPPPPPLFTGRPLSPNPSHASAAHGILYPVATTSTTAPGNHRRAHPVAVGFPRAHAVAVPIAPPQQPLMPTQPQSFAAVPQAVVAGVASRPEQPPRGIPIASQAQPKVIPVPAVTPSPQGHSNSKDKETNKEDSTTVVINDRNPSFGNGGPSLPRPLPASVVDSRISEKENDIENKGSEEGKNDIGEYTASYLLKQHVDRAKKIRAGLQRERLRRIERYKQRLALLLPPPSELGKYDGLP